MEFEINEIKCPRCKHTWEPDDYYSADGPGVYEDECEVCEEIFCVEIDIYSVTWCFESKTYEEQHQEKENKKAD